MAVKPVAIFGYICTDRGSIEAAARLVDASNDRCPILAIYDADDWIKSLGYLFENERIRARIIVCHNPEDFLAAITVPRVIIVDQAGNKDPMNKTLGHGNNDVVLVEGDNLVPWLPSEQCAGDGHACAWDAPQAAIYDGGPSGLMNKAELLKNLDRGLAAMAYGEVARRFWKSTDPEHAVIASCALVSEGEVLLKMDRYEEVDIACSAVVARHQRGGKSQPPGLSVQARHCLARAFLVLGNHEEAINTYDELLTVHSADTQASTRERLMCLAEQLLHELNTELAVRAFRLALRGSNSPEAYTRVEKSMLAVIAATGENGGVGEVIHLCEEALNLFESTQYHRTIANGIAERLLSLGVGLEGQGRADDAERAYGKVLEIPSDGTYAEIDRCKCTATFQQGVIAWKKGDIGTALSLYDEAMRLYNSPSLRKAIAGALLTSTKIENNRGTAEYFSALDYLLKRFGDSHEEAIRQTLAESRFHLAETLMKAGNYGGATGVLLGLKQRHISEQCSARAATKIGDIITVLEEKRSISGLASVREELFKSLGQNALPPIREFATRLQLSITEIHADEKEVGKAIEELNSIPPEGLSAPALARAASVAIRLSEYLTKVTALEESEGPRAYGAFRQAITQLRAASEKLWVRSGPETGLNLFKARILLAYMPVTDRDALHGISLAIQMLRPWPWPATRGEAAEWLCGSWSCGSWSRLVRNCPSDQVDELMELVEAALPPRLVQAITLSDAVKLLGKPKVYGNVRDILRTAEFLNGGTHWWPTATCEEKLAENEQKLAFLEGLGMGTSREAEVVWVNLRKLKEPPTPTGNCCSPRRRYKPARQF